MNNIAIINRENHSFRSINHKMFSSISIQNSSVEGVFPPQRSTHPFRIIEHDAISIHSMTSLGRVGRILAGTVDVSNPSIDKESIQASVTGSVTSNSSVNTSAVTKPTASTINESAPVPVSSEIVATSMPVAAVQDAEAVDQQTGTSSHNVVTLQGKVPEQPEQSEQGRQ